MNCKTKDNKKSFLLIYKWAEDKNPEAYVQLLEASDYLEASKSAVKILEKWKNKLEKQYSKPFNLASHEILSLKSATLSRYREDSKTLKKLLKSYPELKQI